MNSGQLSIAGSFFMGNSATGGSATSSGGAIDNIGSLTVTGTSFGDNSATAAAAGGSASGGGIDNSGVVWVTKCSFLSNSATGGSSSFGGGIHNIGLLTVTNSLFAGNWATVMAAGGSAHGGGIGNSGGVSVTDSTFTSNSARGGFASFGGAIDSSDSLFVDSSYFNGNSATSPYPQTGPTANYGYGGGINNSAMLSVTNSTFTATRPRALTAASAARSPTRAQRRSPTSPQTVIRPRLAVASRSPLGLNPRSSSIDSIFRTRRAETSLSSRAASSSLGHNLFSDDPAVSLDPTDLVNTDPLLGPLAKDNGGLTFTQALLPGSPAINAGIAVAGITTDQRGDPRPSSGPTDIGAFQVEPQPPLTVVSLRLAGTRTNWC